MTIRMKPLKVSKIVVCCVVLHNLAKLWGEPEEFPPEDDQQPPTVLNHDDDMSGKAFREYITMQYFSYNRMGIPDDSFEVRAEEVTDIFWATTLNL
ncbi:hypothetical protein MAR_021824 [Mya arenaria]|uniref:Nuclease HARBI1 n=1 Tax=Mya arenaria TaxID=6604 RepID=A0ABY7E8V2_MYAAR|nr:hypothetical protein MAR_021824 [Mya arenaria]